VLVKVGTLHGIPAYVHMRDSARVAARVDNWLTNGDAPTHARLLRVVTHVVSLVDIVKINCRPGAV
jgi:hypothetical protein